MSKLTQTELAEEFGLSSIGMGKKLIELNLRDKETKLATNYALTNKLGKNITYLKDGKEVKMIVWNEKTLTYLKQKSLTDSDFYAQRILGKLKKLKHIEDEDTGQKIDQWRFDEIYEDFSGLLSNIKNNQSFLNKFYKLLEKEKLVEYASQYEELENLKIIIAKMNLENELKVNNIKEKKSKV